MALRDADYQDIRHALVDLASLDLDDRWWDVVYALDADDPRPALTEALAKLEAADGSMTARVRELVREVLDEQ